MALPDMSGILAITDEEEAPVGEATSPDMSGIQQVGQQPKAVMPDMSGIAEAQGAVMPNMSGIVAAPPQETSTAQAQETSTPQEVQPEYTDLPPLDDIEDLPPREVEFGVSDHLGEIIPQAAKGIIEGVEEAGKTSKMIFDAVIPGFEPANELAANMAMNIWVQWGGKRGELSDALPEPQTMTGTFINESAQFLTGLYGATSLLKTMGWTSTAVKSMVGRETLGSGMSGGVAMDPYTDNLANLLKAYEPLQNIVPWFLTTDTDDSEAELRLKKFLEESALGYVGVALGLAFSSLRASKNGNFDAASVLMRDSEVAIRTEPAPHLSSVEPDGGFDPVSTTVHDTVDDAIDPQAAGTPRKITKVASVSKETLDNLEVEISKATSIVEVEDMLINTDFNLSKMDSPLAIKQTLAAMSKVLAPAIQRITGGVRSNAESRLLADMMGQDEGTLLKSLSDTFEATEQLDGVLLAGRILVQKIGDRVMDLGDQVAADSTSAVKADYINTLQLMSEVYGLTKGIQTNAARATQSGRIKVSGRFNEFDTEALEKAIKDAGGSQKLVEFANKMKGLKGNDAAIRKMLERGRWDRFVGVTNELWINSMLSGPTTQAINMMSNAIHGVVIPTQRVVGAAAMLPFTGDSKPVIEGAAHFMGLYQSAVESITLAGKSFKADSPILDAGNPNAQKIENTFEPFIKAETLGRFNPGGNIAKAIDKVGTFHRLPTRFLLAADEGFKQVTYRANVRSKAYADAWSQGMDKESVNAFVEKRLRDSFDENGKGIDPAALQISREATFTQDLEHGIGKWIQEGKQRLPVVGVAAPFVRTPTNLIRAGWQNIPVLQFFQKNLRDDFAAGGYRRETAVGKVVTSNAIALYIWGLAVEGKTTGSAPLDPNERSAKLATGWKPYSSVSVNSETGKKEYRPYNRMDPYAIPVGIMTDIVNNAQEMDEEERNKALGLLFAGIATNLSNKLYLKSMANMLEAFTDATPRKTEKFVQQYAASHVPNILNKMNPDPFLRESQTIVEAMMSRIPGLSVQLNPKRTVLGEKIPKEAYGLPTDKSIHKDEPVYEEIARLGGIGGDVRKKQGKVDFTQFKNEQGQSAYDRLRELTGQPQDGVLSLKEQLAETIASGEYQGLTKDTQGYKSKRKDILQSILEQYRGAAKSSLTLEYSSFGAESGLTLGQAMENDFTNKATVNTQGDPDILTELLNTK